LGVVPYEELTGLPRATKLAPKTRAFTLSGLRGSAVTVLETFRLALDALRAHKLRSVLTLLGVILAVTTLVVVMSVVAGLNFYIADHVANLGSNVYIVHRFGIITSYDAWIKAQKRPLITMAEYELLRDNMKTALQIAAVEDQAADTRSGKILLESTTIIGATPNYLEIRNIQLGLGRMLTEADNTHHAPVCFVGPDVVKKLFPDVYPIGKTIRAGSHSYEVVGVGQPLGSTFGQSRDNYLLIPITTFYKEWHRQTDTMYVFIQAPSTETIEASQDEARMIMRSTRHLPWAEEDNFKIFGSDSIMHLWKQLTGNLFGVAVALTAVFLVVGGIVIMNIMLASVTERTREIGVRRSLGARKKHIVLQFMTESAVLSAVGGVIGILLAWGLVTLGRTITSIPMQMQVSAVILSLAVSTGVGLFFGIYPAMRAAKLDPIEALRADG